MTQPSEEAVEEIALDLNTMQEKMVDNIQAIKNGMASQFNPVIFTSLILVLIGGGLILSIDNKFLNILALLIVAIVGVGLLVIRHFYYIRSTESALEYVVNGTTLKEPRSIPVVEKIVVFSSPKEVYTIALEILGEDWIDLIPLFEQSLEEVNKADKEDKVKEENSLRKKIAKVASPATRKKIKE